MCLILTVCLYKATSFDVRQGGSAYPPDPGGGRAGLALWGWDNPKGTRQGFMSSFPLPCLCHSELGGCHLSAGSVGGGSACPQMPALYLELTLILIPGHVGCDRRLEQTLLECRQPAVCSHAPQRL